MSREKDWQQILTNLQFDLRVVLRKIKKRYSKIMRAVGEDQHIKNPGQFLEDMAELGRAIGKADALSKSAHDIAENKSKPFADIERQLQARDRIKGGDKWRQS